MNYQAFLLTGVLLIAAAVTIVFIGRPIVWPAPQKSVTSEAELKSDGVSATDARETKRDVFLAARDAVQSPALSHGTWINTGPVTIASLRGRVVIVDFWTFGCYNCRNTLPAIKRWDERYRDKGLTIVGVHSPETDSEKKVSKVQSAVRSLGIRYPVVTDNNYETWRAYGVEAWPTIIVLDKQGRIRWTHIGEGLYDETEGVIRKLIKEEDKVTEASSIKPE